jgi:hypothetical protein
MCFAGLARQVFCRSLCSDGLGCSGEVMTTSEVEAEVGMMMTGIMAGIRIVLQIGMIQGMGRPMMVQGSPRGKV